MRIKIMVMVLLVVAVSTFASKSTSVNVTTIFYDTDSTDAQLLLKSDDYNGSGQATYSPSAVSTYIFSDSRYFLRLYGQSLRTLFITPNSPINGSQPMAPPPGYYWQNVDLAVVCSDQNLNLVPFGNILTFSGNCEMIVDFGDNGTEYKIAMGPSGRLPAPGPATGLVTVTCNSVSSGHCMKWTITPNTTGSSNPPSVANLYRYTGSHQTPLALCRKVPTTASLSFGNYYGTNRLGRVLHRPFEPARQSRT